MTTTINATAVRPILTIDLGKYKSVACTVLSADDQRFTTIGTSRADIIRLLAQHQPSVVLIEACPLGGWVHDLCAEQGVPCLVANSTSKAWKVKHLKRRTDKDDAQRLAEVYRLGKFPTVMMAGQGGPRPRSFSCRPTPSRSSRWIPAWRGASIPLS